MEASLAHQTSPKTIHAFLAARPVALAEKAPLINDTLRSQSFVNLVKEMPKATGSAIYFELMMCLEA